MSGAPSLENVADILPLSPTQQGILYEILADPARRGCYASVQRVVFSGALDPERFCQIFTDAALATDVSRACFVHEGVTQPLQVIRAETELPFDYEDWEGRTDPGTDLDNLELRLLEQPCDLSAAPLMSAHLRRLSADHHVLFWRIHHIVSDGWSARVVLEQVLDRMNGTAPGPAGPGFRDHLERLAGRDRDADRRFLADYMSSLDAPCLLASEAQAGRALFRRTAKTIPEDTATTLARMAQETRVTLATTFFTAWAICLRRMTGQSDVVFGRVTSGRDPAVAGIDRAVGPYLAVLPARFRLDGADSVRATLLAAESGFNAIRPYEGAALADALSPDTSTETPRLPFDTLVSVQGFGLPHSTGPLRVGELHSRDATSFPLALILCPGQEIGIEAVFDPSRIAGDTVDDILSAFATVLEAMAVAPDTALCDLPGLPLPEVSPPEPARHVHLEILAQVQDRQDAVALRDSSSEATYGEMWARAASLATELQAQGIGPGDAVPVSATRRIDTPIAMLAVLLAGAAYVPIDPDYPVARNRTILETLSPCLVISDGPMPGWDGKVLSVPGSAKAAPGFTPAEASDSDPAYIVFTSGSTGQPKGVVVTHGNLAWSTAARAAVYPDLPKVFLHLSSFAFDSSVVGLYWTLTTGGTLALAPPRAEQDVKALARLAELSGATHLLCLPRIWAALLEVLPPSSPLETVIIAGEAVPPSLPALHRDHAPNMRLYNEYGPTEATVWCAAADVTDARDAPPIGKAPPGAAVDVCDRDGYRMPRGLQGELVVRGAGVAAGYFGAFSSGGFVPGPERRYRTGDLGTLRADGSLRCHGRLDTQVKIRGHRVELGEIEAAALAEGAQEAAAVAVQDRIVLATKGAPEDLEDRLIRRLPAAMRPGACHHLPELPRLPNGKIDTGKIAALGFGERACAGPTEGFFESALAEIWSEVLGQPVDGSTSFFDAGGDSLMTIAVLSMAEARGLALKPNDIFDHPRLADLADALRVRQDTPLERSGGRQNSVVNHDGDLSPVLMIHASPAFNARLASALGPDRPCVVHWSHHLAGRAELSRSIEAMAADAIEALTQLRPEGPCTVIGYSLGGVIALEAAYQLARRGRPVTGLVLVDPSFDMAAPRGVREDIAKPLSRWARAGLSTFRLMTSQRNRTDRVLRAAHIYRAILAPYRPPVYSGSTLVLQNAVKPADQMAMRAATPNAERILLPYDHKHLLNDRDAIADVAARIAAGIRAFEQETTS